MMVCDANKFPFCNHFWSFYYYDIDQSWEKGLLLQYNYKKKNLLSEYCIIAWNIIQTEIWKEIIKVKS